MLSVNRGRCWGERALLPRTFLRKIKKSGLPKILAAFMVENKEDITEAAEKMQELLRLLRQRRILQA